MYVYILFAVESKQGFMLNIITIYTVLLFHVNIRERERKWNEHLYTCKCIIHVYYTVFTLNVEHINCQAKCSLILKSSIAAILFPPSSAEENLRGTRSFLWRSFMTVCKMSVEEKLRKLRGKRTLEILINSQRGKFSAEFYGKWGIRVECTVVWSFKLTSAIVVEICSFLSNF